MRIGKYNVLTQLGAGAMGVVYLGEHPTLSQKVAIKLINARLIETRTIADRFLNEARAASQVGHPGIVTVHDFDVDPQTKAPFIVMEYLEGQDLAMHLREFGALDAAAVRAIGGQLADALEAAHAKGIVHRDLKPDNVYLSPDAAVVGGLRAKVLDFGIAKLAGDDVTRMTQGGSVMGTPMYMAPEQARGAESADARSDIYSLGCMLYQMATGQVPFPDAGDLAELFRLHREVPPAPVRSLAPAIDAALAELIESCMAKDPAARPRSMRALHAELAETRDDLASATRPPADVSKPSSARFAATIASSSAPGAAPGSEPGVVAGPLISASDPRQDSRRGSRFWLVGLVLVGLAIGAVAVVISQRGGAKTSAANIADAAVETPPAETLASRGERLNPWIDIPAATSTVALPPIEGLPPRFVELRPEMTAPTTSYQIHTHEVTWGEFYRWYFESQHARDPLYVSQAVKDAELATIARQPATGMTWAAAYSYCDAIGAALPTEAQWEWAARGAGLRANPWGANTAPGETAVEVSMFDNTSLLFPDVMSARGDRTPRGVHDLAGSVFEMTADRLTDPDDPKAIDQYMVIRGSNPQPGASEDPSMALHRALFCASGSCMGDQLAIRGLLGFRCVR